jgi:hypothetical protein
MSGTMTYNKKGVVSKKTTPESTARVQQVLTHNAGKYIRRLPTI